MGKKIIKLNESHLKQIVKQTLNEITMGKYKQVAREYNSLWGTMLDYLNLDDLLKVKNSLEPNLKYSNDPRLQDAYEAVSKLADIYDHVQTNSDNAYERTSSYGFGDEVEEDDFYDDTENDGMDIDNVELTQLRKKYPYRQ